MGSQHLLTITEDCSCQMSNRVNGNGSVLLHDLHLTEQYSPCPPYDQVGEDFFFENPSNMRIIFQDNWPMSKSLPCVF